MKKLRTNHVASSPLTIIDIRQATGEVGDRMYAATLPAAAALMPNVVKPVTVDITTAVGTIEAFYPRVHAMRGTLIALAGFRHEAIDMLPQWTLALGNADARYAATSTPQGALTALVAEGTTLRDLLFAQAGTLGKFGLLDPAHVATLVTGQSHRAIGHDLQALARTYRDRGAELAGKSPVTDQQLARAMYLGEQIIALVAFKDQVPAQASEAADTRRRIFTLVDGAWDEIRRGVTFVRWYEGDLDSIAPSIHANPGTSRKPAGSEPSAPSAPAAQPAAAAAVATVPAALVASHASGTGPLSNPFIDR